MNICKDCLEARTDWTWGGYTDKCEGCNVRGAAKSPKFVREWIYEKALTNGGPEGLEKVKAQVKAEYARIQRLKQKEES